MHCAGLEAGATWPAAGLWRSAGCLQLQQMQCRGCAPLQTAHMPASGRMVHGPRAANSAAGQRRHGDDTASDMVAPVTCRSSAAKLHALAGSCLPCDIYDVVRLRLSCTLLMPAQDAGAGCSYSCLEGVSHLWWCRPDVHPHLEAQPLNAHALGPLTALQQHESAVVGHHDAHSKSFCAASDARSISCAHQQMLPTFSMPCLDMLRRTRAKSSA